MDAFLVVTAVIFFGVAAVLAACACADQRKLWYRLHSWQFRHPELNEPSPAAFSSRRTNYAIRAIIVAVCGVVLLTLVDDLSSSSTPDYSDTDVDTDLGTGGSGYLYP